MVSSLTLTIAASNALQSSKDRADYVCDSSEDNVQIQSAIDELSGIGGRVLLSEGTFKLDDSIQMDDFTTLQGMGFGTVIFARPGLDANLIELKNTSVEQVTLKNFRTFGYWTAQSQGHAIFFDNENGSWSVKEPNHFISDLIITYSSQCGVYLKSPKWCQSRITNVFVFVCGEDGFRIDGPDNVLHGCDVGAADWRGYSLTNAGATRLSMCKAYFSGQQGFLLDSTRLQLLNCQSQDNYGHGFEMAGVAGRISLVSCQSDSNGRDNQRANGFQISVGEKFLMSGCASVDIKWGPDKGQDYGFQIEEGVDCVSIDGYAEGNILGGLNNLSSGTKIDTSRLKEW